MKRGAFAVFAMFLVGFVARFAFGQARTPYTRPASITSPGSITSGAGADQFVCSSTTATCEVESSASATTMTATVPAFDIGPTATPGANDRLACFSYGATGSKSRQMCVDKEGDVSATSGYFGVSETTNNIRVHALNETTTYTPNNFSSQHSVFGRAGESGASSGGVFLSYNTSDNEGVIGALSPGSAWRSLSVTAVNLKFRPLGAGASVTLDNGISTTGNVSSNNTFNSAISSGSNAYTCTNVGCRLSLGNTARYLVDDGTNLEFVAPVQATSFEALLGNVETTGSATTMFLSSSRTSGTSVGLRSIANLTADTDRAVAVLNNTSTEVAHFSKDGLLRVNQGNAAKPTCNADNRGRIYFKNSASLTADVFEVCGKDAADAYAWKAIVSF